MATPRVVDYECAAAARLGLRIQSHPRPLALMKILFDHPSPFLLAHGGFQIQIEQTKLALERNGVEVEFLRWWDEAQRGDAIYYLGRPTAFYIQAAQQKNMKVVLAELLTGLGARPAAARRLQKFLMTTVRQLLPGNFLSRLGWEAYELADACVAMTPWEAHLMVSMFHAPPERVHCIPIGVETVFSEGLRVARGKWLVCTATITERKRVLELAEAAVLAQVPLWIVGKPYSESDPYARKFVQFAAANPQFVRYEGGIADRARLAQVYREARGFVLLSTMESLSLSSFEAAAAGCPLLVSDLPWARSVFDQSVRYCPITSAAATAVVLRQFYDAAPSLSAPAQPKSWDEVGLLLKRMFEAVVGAGRR